MAAIITASQKREHYLHTNKKAPDPSEASKQKQKQNHFI